MHRRTLARRLSPLTFIAPWRFATPRLAHMLDSLVRVSRRVVWGHFVNIRSAVVPHTGMHRRARRHCKQSRHARQHTPHLASLVARAASPQSPRLRKVQAVSPPVGGYLPAPRLQPGKLMLTRSPHKCTAGTFGPTPGTLALLPEAALQTRGWLQRKHCCPQSVPF